MRLGWYYSPADWWHPASRAADWDAYVPYMQAQLRELMTGYGVIDFLAFDYWSPACNHPSWEGFYRELRRLCPHYIHSRNTPWAIGDYEVQEHSAPYFRDPRSTAWSGIGASGGFASRMTCADPFEALICLQPQGWSYKTGFAKSLVECVGALADCATHGGNLTLNVTPDALGRIPSEQTQRLREIGAWMSVHGETIVGTRGGPLLPILIPEAPDQVPAGYVPGMLGGGVRPRGSRCQAGCTSADNRLYMHVWPGVRDAVLELPPEVAKVAVSCHRIDGGSVPYRLVGGWLQAPVPAEPGPITTLTVELAIPAARLPLKPFVLRPAMRDSPSA
jgi:hypothetical protein